MKRTFARSCLAVAMFAVLTACGSRPSATSRLNAEVHAQRVQINWVTFSLWQNAVSMDVAVAPAPDGASCQFIDPLKTDGSIIWAPSQAYWTVYDAPRNVQQGSTLSDYFFAGDTRNATEFPKNLEKDPLGFRWLTRLEINQIGIRSYERRDNGSLIVASAKPPVDAFLAAKTVPAAEGCTTKTFYCRTAAGCEQYPTNYRPLKSIFVEQNALGMPRNIIFNEG